MDVFVYTFLLLGAATYMGHLMVRLKQPEILGEILGGILVGPVALFILSIVFVHEKPELIRFFSHEEASSLLQSLIDFSAVFIMLGAGLEIDRKDLLKAGKASVLTAVFGVIVPFSLGLYVGRILLGLSLLASLYIATALSITAVALSVATLLQVGKLNTKPGITIIGAAVVDDILGILILSVLTSVKNGGDLQLNLIIIKFIKALFFIGLSITLGPFIGRKIFKHTGTLSSNERLSLVLIWVFVFSMIAHLVNLHLMIGAFLGGLTVREYLHSAEVENLERWIWGFFAPLFFAWTGFSVTLSGSSLGLSLLYIVLAAFMGKIIGGSFGALLGGIRPKHTLIVGIGMNGRAAVELVIANIALMEGIISREIYSSIVFMAIITAVSTPLLLSMSIKKLNL